MSSSMSSNLSSLPNSSSLPSTLPTSPPSLLPSSIYLAVHVAIRVLWSLFSLAGNSLTLVAVFRFPSLRAQPANFLLCSLTLADLLGVVLPVLVFLHQIVLYGKDGYVAVCLIEKIISIMSCRGNIYSLFLMAFDRFISIAYPLRYHSLVTPSRVWVTLGIMWSWIFIETPLLVGIYHRLTLKMNCMYFTFLSDIYSKYYVPQLVLFLLMTIVLYVIIARIAIKQSRIIEDATAAVVGANVSGTRKERKVAKMMGLVLGAYLITYIPSAVVGIMLGRNQTLRLLRVEKVVTIIFWMGMWVNPLIYAWKSRDFRRAFKIILHLRKPQDDQDSQVTE